MANPIGRLKYILVRKAEICKEGQLDLGPWLSTYSTSHFQSLSGRCLGQRGLVGQCGHFRSQGSTLGFQNPVQGMANKPVLRLGVPYGVQVALHLD